MIIFGVGIVVGAWPFCSMDKIGNESLLIHSPTLFTGTSSIIIIRVSVSTPENKNLSLGLLPLASITHPFRLAVSFNAARLLPLAAGPIKIFIVLIFSDLKI